MVEDHWALHNPEACQEIPKHTFGENIWRRGAGPQSRIGRGFAKQKLTATFGVSQVSSGLRRYPDIHRAAYRQVARGGNGLPRDRRSNTIPMSGSASGISPDQLSVQTSAGHLLVTAIANGALRVQCASTIDSSTSPVLINIKNETAALKNSGGNVTLSTSRMSAAYDKDSEVLRFYDGISCVLEESLGGRRITPSTIQSLPTSIAEVSFESPKDERLYGSGQFQDGFLNIRDLPRRLTQVNSQIAIPFIVSSRGYGVLWNNLGMVDLNPTDQSLVLRPEAVGKTETRDYTTSRGTETITRVDQTFGGEFHAAKGRYAMMLDIGQDMAQQYHVVIDGVTVVDFANRWLPPTTSWFLDLKEGTHRVVVKALTEDKPVLHWRSAGSKTVFRSPVSSGIDYVVFAGSADETIATYRQLTGQAPLMPLWTYGFIQCRERYTSSDHMIATAKEFRKRQLPMDVIVQDWMYWGKYGWNAMQWDEDHYPDPAALVRQLHDMQVRLMVSVWSKVEPKSDVGRELTAKKLYIPGTQWVDFFNPEARKVYWSNFSRRMLSLGIDAWWMDATEPENDALANATTFAGPGDVFRLLYPLLVTQTIYEGQRKDAPDRRVCILTRSAFLGEQRYAAATWSGDVGHDWDTLRRQVAAGLNYCVSGLPYWTTDTGGFFRPEAQYTDKGFHERYLRWLQFSTFTPLMRVHGYQTETEPWHYGDEVEKVQRDYVNLRYQLLPYIYSEAARITFNGSTIMRPLVMDFAHDQRALEEKYEFMFGPAFLVAPVVESASKWKVYVPDAKGWYDWWTEEKITGGETIIMDTPLAKIPLLVRAGSVVPLGQVAQHTGPSSNLEIRVYPGDDGTFELYEDVGTDYSYENGEFSRIRLHWSNATRALSIGQREGSFPGMANTRAFNVRLVGSNLDKHVVYEGEEVIVHLDSK